MRQHSRGASRCPSCCGRARLGFNIPEGVRLVHCHLPVPQHPVIQNRKAAFVLVIDHSSPLGVYEHVLLKRYASDVVRGGGIACGLDHTVLVVECFFILEPVGQCALVKWHLALEQLEVEWYKNTDNREHQRDH